MVGRGYIVLVCVFTILAALVFLPSKVYSEVPIPPNFTPSIGGDGGKDALPNQEVNDTPADPPVPDGLPDPHDLEGDILDKFDNLVKDNKQPASNPDNTEGGTEIDNVKKEVENLKDSLAQQSEAVESLSNDVDSMEEKINRYLGAGSGSKGVIITVSVFGLLIIGAIAVLIFLLLQHRTNPSTVHNPSIQRHLHQKHQHQIPISVQHPNAFPKADQERIINMVNYITTYKKRGYTIDVLKQGLLSQGYNLEEINIAINKSAK